MGLNDRCLFGDPDGESVWVLRVVYCWDFLKSPIMVLVLASRVNLCWGPWWSSTWRLWVGPSWGSTTWQMSLVVICLWDWRQ